MLFPSEQQELSCVCIALADSLAVMYFYVRLHIYILLMTVMGAEASKACMYVLYKCHFLLDVVDHSRVILKVPDETGCDYINASDIAWNWSILFTTCLNVIMYCFCPHRAMGKRVHTLPHKVHTHVAGYADMDTDM